MTGGAGGILLPPFLLSSCHPYTLAIIYWSQVTYNEIPPVSRVSIVSPIRYSSAENGISGISEGLDDTPWWLRGYDGLSSTVGRCSVAQLDSPRYCLFLRILSAGLSLRRRKLGSR